MAFALTATPSLLLILPITIMVIITMVPSILAVDLSPQPSNGPDFIRSSCNATLYPDLCYRSLSRYAFAVQRDPAQLARVAVAVSLSKARRMARYLSALSRQPSFGAEPRALSALRDCFSTLGDAVDEIRSSLAELRRMSSSPGSSGSARGADSFRFQMGNVQTWMSAALTNEDTCTDGFDVVADSPVKTGVCDRATKVRKVTSNALALVNSFAAKVEGEEVYD